MARQRLPRRVVRAINRHSRSTRELRYSSVLNWQLPIENALRGEKLGQNRGRIIGFWPSTKSIVCFAVPKWGCKGSSNSGEDFESTSDDRQTDRHVQTDRHASDFIIISPMLYHSNGTDYNYRRCSWECI